LPWNSFRGDSGANLVVNTQGSTRGNYGEGAAVSGPRSFHANTAPGHVTTAD
jgi:hypothetical protein